MRYLSVLFLVILMAWPVGNTQAQQADSLIAVIKSQDAIPKFVPDTTFVNTLLVLAYELEAGKLDSAIIVANRAFEISKNIGFVKGQLNALERHARALELQSDYTSSVKILLEAIALARSLNQTEKVAKWYTSAGMQSTYIGKYTEAIDYALQSQRLAEKENNKHLQANNYNTLAMVYYYQRNFEEALINYEKCKVIAAEIGKMEVLANAISNIGHIHLDQKQYDQALAAYNESMEISRKAKLNFMIGINLSSIANVYALENEFKKAIGIFKEALKIQSRIGDVLEETSILGDIGHCYFSLDEYDSALYYTLKAHRLGEEINSLYYLKKTASNLSGLYKQRGDYKLALHYHEKFKQYSDTINSQEAKDQTVRLEEQYKYEKKELLLTKTNEETLAKRTLWIYVIGVGLFFTVALIIVLQRNIRHRKEVNLQLLKNEDEITRKNKELEAMDSFKNRLLSVVAHDVRGPLNSLKGMFYLFDNHSFSGEQIAALIKQLEGKVGQVSNFVDDLLMWARNQMLTAEIKSSRFELAKTITQTLELLKPMAETKEISIQTKLHTPSEVMADQEMVKIVIRNLISNAIKFSKSRDVISIQSSVEDRHVMVSVRDSGVGMGEEKLAELFVSPYLSSKGTGNEIGTGLGLLLCKQYIEMNNGTIGAESTEGKGSHFWFTLPLN